MDGTHDNLDPQQRLAAMLRQAADGELNATERNKIADSTENAARVEFERRLRSKVNDAMGMDVQASASLRNAVQQLFANTPTTNTHDISDGELLRRAADDELTPAQQAQLTSRLADRPDDANRIQFEHGLRSHVAAAMDEIAPTNQHDNIVTAVTGQPPEHAPEIVTTPASTLPSFWARWSRPAMGLAAVLAIAAIFGVISDTRNQQSDGFSLSPAAFQSASKFVEDITEEHARCRLALSEHLQSADNDLPPRAAEALQKLHVTKGVAGDFHLVAVGEPLSDGPVQLWFCGSVSDGTQLPSNVNVRVAALHTASAQRIAKKLDAQTRYHFVQTTATGQNRRGALMWIAPANNALIGVYSPDADAAERLASALGAPKKSQVFHLTAQGNKTR